MKSEPLKNIKPIAKIGVDTPEGKAHYTVYDFGREMRIITPKNVWSTEKNPNVIQIIRKMLSNGNKPLIAKSDGALFKVNEVLYGVPLACGYTVDDF